MISNPSSPIGMVLAPDIQRTGVEVERLLEEMGMKEDQDAVARRKQERREVPGEVEWVGRIVCLKDKNASQDQVLEVIGKLRASPRVLSAGPMLDARDFWDSDVYFQIEGPDPAFLEAYLKEMGGKNPNVMAAPGGLWKVTIPSASKLDDPEKVLALSKHPKILEVTLSRTSVYLDHDL